MPDWVARRLMSALNREKKAVNGSRILLLGLAYKKNTSDDRESPALVVAQRLLDLGAAVRAADPHVVATSITHSPSPSRFMRVVRQTTEPGSA